LKRKQETGLLNEARLAVSALVSGDRERVSVPLGRVLARIEERIFDFDLRIEDVARECDVNDRWIRRHFRAELECTARRYVTVLRLEAAQCLLESGNFAVWQVAELVGFKSATGFISSFKSWAGVSPGKLMDSKPLSPGSHKPHRETPKAPDKKHFSKADSPPGGDRSPPGESTRDGDTEARRELEAMALEILWPVLRSRPASQLAKVLRRGYRPDRLLLIRSLLRFSIEKCRDNRKLGAELVDLALKILPMEKHRLSSEEYLTLEIEALTALGNARRLAGNWSGAEKAFTTAEHEMRNREVSLHAVAAFLFHKGLLRAFQRRLPEAHALLGDAVEVAENLDDSELLAKTLLARGQALELEDRLDTALDDYRRASRLVEGMATPDSYLVASVYSHLVSGLAALGDCEEASIHLQAVRKIVDSADSSSLHARVTWLEGLLAHKLGRLPEAHRSLVRSKADLLALGDGLNVAVLNLDLALVCLQQQSVEEAISSASEALVVLKTIDLESEAMGALDLLDRAIRKRRLAKGLILEMRGYLGSQICAPRRWQQ